MATGVAPPPDREEIRRRLREDYEFAIDTAEAAQIVLKSGQAATMQLKRPQRRLARALMAQRESGEPQRAQLLKSRQVGMSTFAQVVGILRTTQTENHLAITVAQDRDTVSSLFDKGRFAWAHLPAQIKPPAAFEGNTKERRFLTFGEPSAQLRRAGVLGLNSQYETATAGTAYAGRGRTIHTLHLSEPAWWVDYSMMLGIVQGVPDLPNSLILKESTANGNNEFKDEWDDAVSGTSGYIAFFSPWYEEAEYRRRFPNELERDEFEKSLGTGRSKREQEAAAEELDLLVQIRHDLAAWMTEDGEAFTDETLQGRALEHLHWRRWAIGNKAQGNLENFHQEYPSNADEAFMSTGRKVFKAKDCLAALKICERTDPIVPSMETPGPGRGALRGQEARQIRSRRGGGVTVEVPRRAVWVPRRKVLEDEVPRWRVWELPQQEQIEALAPGVVPRMRLGQQILRDGTLWTPEGQYLVNVDTASGEEDDAGTVHANHAITVIDHRTLALVAEYESQEDPDALAAEVHKAALFFNGAWVVVESTGGWGLPVLRRLTQDFHYPLVYTRLGLQNRTDDMQDQLGFSTDVTTKPLLVANAIELLREHPELIRSRVLAQQMVTYVRDKRGRTLPEQGKVSDVLMSWMIGQYVATLRPIRADKPGDGAKRAEKRAGKTRAATPRPTRRTRARRR